VSTGPATISDNPAFFLHSQRIFCLSPSKESFVSHKTIIALTTAVALGCVPFATNAFAAGHPAGGHSGGHATGGHAMGGHPGYARGGHGGQYGGGYYGNGPVYDTCDGYNGCPGYGVPFVGGLINGALGGY
jgi:hypothetical protein